MKVITEVFFIFSFHCIDVIDFALRHVLVTRNLCFHVMLLSRTGNQRKVVKIIPKVYASVMRLAKTLEGELVSLQSI